MATGIGAIQEAWKAQLGLILQAVTGACTRGCSKGFSCSVATGIGAIQEGLVQEAVTGTQCIRGWGSAQWLL